MKMRQLQLRCGNTETTVWLEENKRVKLGTRLSLKDDERIWTVTHKGTNTKEKSKIHTKWNNNI